MHEPRRFDIPPTDLESQLDAAFHPSADRTVPPLAFREAVARQAAQPKTNSRRDWNRQFKLIAVAAVLALAATAAMVWLSRQGNRPDEVRHLPHNVAQDVKPQDSTKSAISIAQASQPTLWNMRSSGGEWATAASIQVSGHVEESVLRPLDAPRLGARSDSFSGFSVEK